MADMNGNGKSWWLTALQTVGLPTAACIVLAYVFNETIEWERDKMLPAIEKNAAVVQSNTDVLKEVNETLEDLLNDRQGKK